MLLWKIRALNGQVQRQGWIVASSHAEASDVARREKAQLISEPIEWLPGYGAKVIWLSGHKHPAE